MKTINPSINHKMTSPLNQAYIGVGSNLGDSKQILYWVIQTLQKDFQNVKVAPLYQSSPVGENAGGEDYLNTVIGFQTTLSAIDLLKYLLSLENKQGRQRPYPNAPRTLDLDLLLYNQEKINTPTLTVPHPRMHQRAFVLHPLHDIAPTLQLPQGDWALLFEHCADQTIQKLNW